MSTSDVRSRADRVMFNWSAYVALRNGICLTIAAQVIWPTLYSPRPNKESSLGLRTMHKEIRGNVTHPRSYGEAGRNS